jgi:hypothetical protein
MNALVNWLFPNLAQIETFLFMWKESCAAESHDSIVIRPRSRVADIRL